LFFGETTFWNEKVEIYEFFGQSEEKLGKGAMREGLARVGTRTKGPDPIKRLGRNFSQKKKRENIYVKKNQQARVKSTKEGTSKRRGAEGGERRRRLNNTNSSNTPLWTDET